MASDEFTGTKYQLAGIETYTQYRAPDEKTGQKTGTFYMSGLKAVFTRAGEFPQLPRPVSEMLKIIDDPHYKKPEIHYVSAQELCEAILCAQEGISQHAFREADTKEAGLKAIIDDLGVEKLRRALAVMTSIKPKDLSQTEGVQFIPSHRLIFR